MNACKNMNLSMVRGDTLAFSFEVEGIDSLDTAYFSCKANADDDAYVAPEDTSNIEIGSYYYDLEIGVNSDIYTILKGVLKVEQDVTRGE